MMLVKIAARNLFRNTRRSVTTPSTITIGAAAVLVFGGYITYIQYTVQTNAVQRTGSGQASNGDVLTVNLARDYTTTIVGEETLQHADRQSRDCWHLDMKAATPDAIYNRIEYWVERGTSRSVKAKFYADSGRLLKIAYYHRYEQRLDGMRPTEVILIDAVNSNLATTIGYSDYRFQEIPDAWFQRDYPAAFEGRVIGRAAGAVLIVALLGARPATGASDMQQQTTTQSSPDGEQKPATPPDAKKTENDDLDRIPNPQPSSEADARPAASRRGNERAYVETLGAWLSAAACSSASPLLLSAWIASV